LIDKDFRPWTLGFGKKLPAARFDSLEIMDIMDIYTGS